jgi:hypothetical protein
MKAMVATASPRIKAERSFRGRQPTSGTGDFSLRLKDVPSQ